MAVPKRRMSKARRDSRRANWKLEVPGLVACPQCKEPKMPHRVKVLIVCSLLILGLSFFLSE